jgi:hypothetical protein
MNYKHWWESKTILINLAIGIITAIEVRLELIQPLLSVNLYSIISLLLVIANVFLRTITHKGVSLNATNDTSQH